ncbi:ankyrin repeat and zinc finger domain-containing protein 1-like [Macrosteles quadrilineatus]|uniref:ankyrin repeat and zinc finger domain-containing protein 1-like n=1 Tax=Macrosteles quadrilineatus TaxID=74068 RepID=UPI0023E16F97|nr:ankyrin repeat and zinc finger domain-containing protein 1-like [Macrosteles quadrilineatus]
MAEEVKTVSTCSIFDEESFCRLTKGIQVSPLVRLKQTPCLTSEEDARQLIQELNVSDRLFCSFCDVSFSDQSQQRHHYKMDWHRYNLKQHLANRKLFTEDRFYQITEQDDVSSISGSETESESELGSLTETEDLSDERLSHLVARRARLLFENQSGKLISVYQCLVHSKKSELPTEEQLVSSALQLPIQNQWMIIMLGGGHMAAAIFKGTEAIKHKTFHSYTVRAKQGGGQSGKDNSGKHAKSAGASLRRYNEQALTQHVQEIVSAWTAEVAACHLIFYRAVGPFNRGVLFGGKTAPLNKADPRLRTVPFPTRRATFSEVQRVHSLLSTATVYDSPEVFRSTLLSPRRSRKDEAIEETVTPVKPESPKKHIDRAKSRPSPDRALPEHVTLLAEYESSDSEFEQDNHSMIHNDKEISFGDSLQEFQDTVPKKPKRKRKKKEPTPEKEFSAELKSFRQKVVTACAAGDVTLLTLSLQQEGSVINEEERTEAVNQLNTDGLSLLQSAARHSHKEIVWILLENGANPCTKDQKAMTAYDFAPDKDTRNTFRRFMGQFPDKYDYSKSHIPSALTNEIEREAAEKRRAQRKAKREKEREKRIADEPRRQEEAERKRFLELSDREKRALAAERRLLAAAGKSGVVLTRCYLCAIDITGKVPFTYETNLFCSMPCLKAHRIQQK